MTANEIHEIARRLAVPFDSNEVKFKPQVVSGNRALAIPFVDARVIQDRLDEVLGVMAWQDNYECLPDGAVICRLKIRIGEEWITKEDVGGPSEQPDEGDRRKAAFSDALKRAAVKFGIGRYLYRQTPQWWDYDPQKKQFLKTPTLPKVSKETGVKAVGGNQTKDTKKQPPQDGKELLSRLQARDQQLSQTGKIKPGVLIKHILTEGVKHGFDPAMEKWDAKGIGYAIETTKKFQQSLEQAV
jgi:hypothetical protein